MASTRKPILGSWLMRTTALSAAVLITSIPLIVSERLGSPENQTLALAREAPGLEPVADITAAPDLDLTVADLHAVSVADFTAGIERLVARFLGQELDSSEIAVRIGAELGKNHVSGLYTYTPGESETLLRNTAIIVGQLMDAALPSMPTWRDLVQLGFDEITAPSVPLQPTRKVAYDLSAYAAFFGSPGYDIY